MSKHLARIGIYAGVFNPVHAGHVAFAIQAMERAKLDSVYFMPERQPWHKQGVEHFAHRVAMLKRAARPHPQFGVLELPDINFSVQRTLPRLQKQFPGSQLVFLFGSDAISDLPEWPHIASLLESCELVVGMRNELDQRTVNKDIAGWPVQPKVITIFASYAPDVSSGKIRDALRKRTYVRGVLKSVEHYSNLHWLYVSLN
jgi:nicotinate-nucleotide adenylyltransferase